MKFLKPKRREVFPKLADVMIKDVTEFFDSVKTDVYYKKADESVFLLRSGVFVKKFLPEMEQDGINGMRIIVSEDTGNILGGQISTYTHEYGLKCTVF